MILNFAKRERKDVLPSGVEVVYRAYPPTAQSDLFKNFSENPQEAYAHYVSSSLISLGDKTDLQKEDVDNLLDKDLKYLLLQISNFTFRKSSNIFPFTYIFERDKEGVIETSKEHHEVDMSSFDHKPFAWVADKMQEDKAEKEEFPVMYGNYEEMLKAHQEQVWEMVFDEEDAKVIGAKSMKIFWNIPQVKSSYSKALEGLGVYDIPYVTRNPRFKMKDVNNPESNEIVQSFDFMDKEVPSEYGESFKKEFLKIEAQIDSTISVKSKKFNDQQVSLDLLTIKEFYSPSLAES